MHPKKDPTFEEKPLPANVLAEFYGALKPAPLGMRNSLGLKNPKPQNSKPPNRVVDLPGH